MLTQEQMERKGVVVDRLIKAVDEYFRVFDAPIPMKALSARFAKALNQLGGFCETLDELQSDGTLEILMTRSGGKLVQPRGAKPKVQPIDAVLLKHG